MDRLPFSPYDFFGYLAAGFVGLLSIDRAFMYGNLLDREYSGIGFVVVVLLAYVAGQIIATPSAAVLEGLIAKRWIGDPTSFLLGTRDAGRLKRFLFRGYTKQLPKELCDRIASLLQKQGLATNHETVMIYGTQSLRGRAPDLAGRLDSFLNLYGFSRNITFSLLLAAIILVIGHPLEDRGLAILAVVLAATMFYRYLKFYRLYAQEVCVHLAQRVEAPKEVG